MAQCFKTVMEFLSKNKAVIMFNADVSGQRMFTGQPASQPDQRKFKEKFYVPQADSEGRALLMALAELEAVSRNSACPKKAMIRTANQFRSRPLSSVSSQYVSHSAQHNPTLVVLFYGTPH